MNIISELNKYLNEKLTPYAPIIQDVFTPDTEGIVCRHDPSTAKETKYLDGTSVGLQNASYYARSKDQKKAREQLDAFIAALDLCDIEISNGIFVKCEVVTAVSFVSKLENGAAVYTCAFRVEYERSI